MAKSPSADALAESGNRIVQSLWIGPLSPLEQMCMASFVARGHEFHLYAYQRPDGVPAGVQVLDAAEILPPATVFCNCRGRGKGSYAGFADLFRYKLLWQRGGWWVDADVFCLRPFHFAAPYVFGAEDKPVANGVIKAPAGCELMRRCYEEAARYDHQSVVWNELGDIFSNAVLGLGLASSVLPPQVFSPIPFYEIVDYVCGRRQFTVSPESYGIHLYNEMWRRKGLNKYRRYPAQSIFEQLRQRVVGLSAPMGPSVYAFPRWWDRMRRRAA
jgi:hypothetical protein